MRRGVCVLTAAVWCVCTALVQGLVEETMEMYQELHKWEESIAVAESRQHAEVATLKANYLQWLTETGQVPLKRACYEMAITNAEFANTGEGQRKVQSHAPQCVPGMTSAQ